MKTTLRWLQEFVDLPTADPAEIEQVLGSLGLEVESVTRVEAPFADVKVARVTAIRPHPDADKIRLATVDTGDAEIEVVCGAWNFEAGDVVTFSPVGATLRAPDGAPFTVERRAIRGVESPGMICSLRELGLGEDHEGILVLEPDAPVGADFVDLLPIPDVVFEIDITPNRPDAMSTVGIARELAAYYDLPLRPPEIAYTEAGPDGTVTVTIEDPEGCPRFTAREVRDLTVGSAPLWMSLRLEACGVRSISNVVDISNYVMLELGYPNHVFDRDLLGEAIVVRRARPGERLITLDGVDRELHPDDLVVADAAAPVGLAGVMGGGDSEVRGTTRNVVIEAAYWHPPSVLVTAKRHGLHTEASSRFQRGMDPNAADVANQRVAQLLERYAGGVVAPGAVDAYPGPVAPHALELPLAEITRVTGTAFDAASAGGLLRRLGFEVAGADPLVVSVPTRRPDVTRPVDLVEEIARLHGYDRFGDRVAVGQGGGLSVAEQRLRRLHEVMVGAGYSEAITLSFLGQADLDRLDLPRDDPRREGIHVTNPLREEEGVLRTTLLASLLGAAANNVSRGTGDVALFETAKVYLPDAGGDIPRQPDVLCWVAVGTRGGSWAHPAQPVDVLDATGVWGVLQWSLRLDGARLRQASPPAFHPERAGEIEWDGEVIGVVGEIHPRVAANFGLPGRVAAGELSLERVIAAPPSWSFHQPSSYPPVKFDLAFELADDVPAQALVASIRDAAGPMLEELEIFDVFSGDPLPAGRKSIALHLALRAPDRTLTDEEARPLRASIVAAAQAGLGARLRGGEQ